MTQSSRTRKKTSPQANSRNAHANDRNKIPPEFYDVLELGIQLREEQDSPISISFLQRRMGFGWPKAAKIYDLMDRMGYLTPDEHDPKKKKVNVTYEELEKLREEAEKEEEE